MEEAGGILTDIRGPLSDLMSVAGYVAHAAMRREAKVLRRFSMSPARSTPGPCRTTECIGSFQLMGSAGNYSGIVQSVDHSVDLGDFGE
jgi:hypothetical protein